MDMPSCNPYLLIKEEEEADIISKDTLTKPLKRKKSTCGHALDLCPKRNSINNKNKNNCCYATNLIKYSRKN
jgi:hypothetical protein